MLNDWRDSYSEKLKRLKKKKNNQLALAMTPQVVGGGAGLLAGQQLGSMGATAAAKAFRPGMLTKNISVGIRGKRVVSRMNLKPQYEALARLAGGTVGGIVGNRAALPITQNKVIKSLRLGKKDRQMLSPDAGETIGMLRDLQRMRNRDR